MTLLSELYGGSSKGLPMGYFYGGAMTHGADTEHDITIATGSVRDSTNNEDMILNAAITKRADAAWAVGTDNGGMDTGAIPASATLHVWLIKRSDTGIVDALFSISATAPTMPTNYDYKRLIGSYRTDASNNIINGDWWGTGVNRIFMFDTPILDVSAATPGTNAVTAALSVPGGIVVNCFLNGLTEKFGYISALNNTDMAPSTSVSPLSTTHSTAQATQVKVFSNTLSQIRYRVSENFPIRITTLGWEQSL